MATLVLKADSTWFSPTVSTITKDTITEINIVDLYSPTGNVVDSWDASADQDGSIMVYVEGTVLTISGNGSGYIALGEDASYVFADFHTVTAINGLNLIDTSASVNMGYIFYQSNNITSLDISSWDTRNADNMTYFFGAYKAAYAMKLKTITLGSNFDTSKVTNFLGMFENCRELITVDTSTWKTSNVTDMSWMFNYCVNLEYLDVSGWDTGKVVNLESMFQKCTKLQTIDVKNWNTSSCTDMGYMFYDCKGMKSINFEDWDVSNVTDFNHFMAHAYLEEFDVSKWKVSNKCINLNAMFHTAMVKYLDVSNFDTSNVTTMSQMFENNERLEEIKGLENFNTSKVTSFQDLFNNAFAIRKLDFSSFDARNILYVANMFNRVTLDEFIISDNYVFTGDQNYQSHFFPNSTTGYWYDLYGNQYIPDEAPRGKAMSYFSTEERAREALMELNGKKYVSLKSLALFHTKHKEETDVKFDDIQAEIDAFEEVTLDDINSLFI